MTASTEATYAASGGLSIFYRTWKPDGAPRAVVLVVPGFNSHSGQYQWVGEHLAGAGFIAYGVDLRGRGKSGGERFYVDTIDDYVADVKGVADIATRENPGLPVFIFGHSAGGVVATTYVLKYQSSLAGLISESFAYQVPAPDAAIAVLTWISRFAPRLKVLKLPNAAFSRDPAAVAALDADPLTANETQPAKTVAALANADKVLKTSFGRITLPVLILHGTLDKATRPSGSQEFFDNTGSKDKTLRLYGGHFHDLLADIGKEQVMAEITGWLAARVK